MNKLKKNNDLYSVSGSFVYRSDSANYVPKIQSHRGYCQSQTGIRENTLAAIQKSYELNYEMVEFDVRMTKDNHVILFHDERYKNLQISKSNLNQLRSEIHIDTLSDVFDWFQLQINKAPGKMKFKLNIEIKSKVIHNRLELQIYQLIQKFEMKKHILISSFNPISLYHFYKFDSEIFRSLLLSNETDHGNNIFIRKMIFNFMAKPNALHLRQEDLNPELLKKFIVKKIPVILWTCNDITKAKQYLSQGVSGIISDQILPHQI